MANKIFVSNPNENFYSDIQFIYIFFSKYLGRLQLFSSCGQAADVILVNVTKDHVKVDGHLAEPSWCQVPLRHHDEMSVWW